MSTGDELAPGDIVWMDFNPVEGREQGGRRPAVVISSPEHLELATTLVMVVPITSKNRRWPNHVRIEPAGLLEQESFAMTEQVRTVSRDRVRDRVGAVAPAVRRAIGEWVADWIDGLRR